MKTEYKITCILFGLWLIIAIGNIIFQIVR